jgi:glycosyltransferase involved in cell wall biosynthesis
LKPRVAIIIPGGIGTGHNNIGVPVLERIVKLLSADFEITVFSLFKINENYKQNNFELISISGSNMLVKIVKFIALFNRHQLRNRFHIVHGFWALPSGFLAVLMGKLFGIKSVVSVLGGDAIALPEINYGQLQKKIPRALILWALAKADEVISLTRYLYDKLKAYGLKREIRVVPWGIDTSLFNFSDRPPGDPIIFLHIANLNAVKDQGTMLKAFKIISDKIASVLNIIGEGVLEAHVKAMVSDLGLKDKVNFLGVLPYEKLPDHYHEADILLHTSLSEGQSEVVTEAMNSGVIVCGTNVGILYDEPDCCVSVPVKDFQGLANEVLTLLDNPERMLKVKQNAHAWASYHSIQWTAKRISELYRKLSGGHT